MGATAAIVHDRHPDPISGVCLEHEMPEVALKLLVHEFRGQVVLVAATLCEADRLWTDEDNRLIARLHWCGIGNPGVETTRLGFHYSLSI